VCRPHPGVWGATSAPHGYGDLAAAMERCT
jgi:hypothetical protein